MFGLETYLENYGTIQKGKVHLGGENYREEFEDWMMTIPFAVGDGKETLDVEILCCPEDKRCTSPAARVQDVPVIIVESVSIVKCRCVESAKQLWNNLGIFSMACTRSLDLEHLISWFSTRRNAFMKIK